MPVPLLQILQMDNFQTATYERLFLRRSHQLYCLAIQVSIDCDIFLSGSY